jgi:uncharacterized membrane protein
MRALLGLIGAVVVIAWCAHAAHAQETGSSFGGGDFSSSSDSSSGWSSSGSSDWGGSSGWSSSSGSSDWSSGSSSGGSGRAGPIGFVFLVMVVIVIGAFMVQKSRSLRGPRVPVYTPMPMWHGMDVSILMLGLDWRARRELQGELARLATQADPTNRLGRAYLLQETVLLLRRFETSWIYAAAKNYQPMHPSEAEAVFRQAAGEMRSRFKKELIRSDETGRRTQDAPELRAKSEEGPGFVVITLCVAARRDLLDVTHVSDANQLRRLLGEMSGLGVQALVALEVIWSPAAEEDRLSSAELEVLYPELKKIDERSIAGRIFCAYCGSPFAAELTKCPHCGAALQAAAQS